MPTPAARVLSTVALDSLTPKAAQYEERDAKIIGLRLVVQPSGFKSWVVRYTVKGRDRKLTIGPYPRVRLAQARKLASAALRAVAEGKDPATEKIAARREASGEDTVGAAFETFAKLHLGKKRESTRAEVRRLFEKRILPKWRDRRLSDITRRDVLAVLDSMIASGAPVSANRALAAMSVFFNWCVGRDLLAHSPTAGIKRPTAQRSRDRVLSDDELTWLWRACERIGWPFGTITQLLILLGARRDEIRAMNESELDLQEARWLLPAERSKNHTAHLVHLAPLPLRIMKKSPRVVNKAGFVFSTNGKTAASGFSRAKRNLDKAMLEFARADAEALGDDPDKVKIAPWVVHDLRRTMASGMARLGVPLPVIERCLNHRGASFAGVAGIYQRHTFEREQADAFDKWAEHVAALIKS